MSQPSARAARVALVAAVLVFVVGVGGYFAGKQMALRDNARAVPAADS